MSLSVIFLVLENTITDIYILSYYFCLVEMKMMTGMPTVFLVFAQINSYNPPNNPSGRYSHHLHPEGEVTETQRDCVIYVRSHSTKK